MVRRRGIGDPCYKCLSALGLAFVVGLAAGNEHAGEPDSSLPEPSIKEDNSRSQSELGITYRPLTETFTEHAVQLIRDGRV